MTYHVRKGERLLLYSRFRDVGSTGTPADIQGSVKVLYDDDEGFDYRNVGAIRIPATGTGISQSDVATFLAEPFRHDGEIVDARLWGSALVGNASVQRGQVAATLGVWYRDFTNPSFRIELCRGYLWQGRPSFGLGELEVLGPSGGSGNHRTITVADPAAEVDVGDVGTVPADAIWRVHSVSATLVTSADAGSRVPRLVVTDGTTERWRHTAPVGQGASVTRAYLWDRRAAAAANTTGATLTGLHGSVPSRDLPEAFVVNITTEAFDAVAAGDNWGAVEMLVEEWLML